MPGGVTTPQGTFAGINPAHPSRFGWFPVVDARRETQKERDWIFDSSTSSTNAFYAGFARSRSGGVYWNPATGGGQ